MNDEWMSISRIDFAQNQEELNKKFSIKKMKQAFFLHFHNFPSNDDLWIKKKKNIYIYIYNVFILLKIIFKLLE